MAAKEKTRYSDSELVEFKELIEKKLEEAQEQILNENKSIPKVKHQ